MSGFSPDTPGIAGAPGYGDLPGRRPRIPLILVLAHLALGGVAVALAVNEEFARGKAAFASDAWKIALGVTGAGLAFLAVRGIVRNLNDSVPTRTEERRRSGRIGGRILLLAGLGLIAVATSDALAESSIAFESWAKPFFLGGGIYLTLMGLVLQMNPAPMLARQRLAQGEGLQGTATILRANDTGTTMDGAPQVEVDFEVEVEGRKYEASQRLVMEQAKLALLIPGSTVKVAVDREAAAVFTVDWDSWRGPGA